MKVQEKSADYLVNSQATQWQQGTLGELLPIKYGKSLPEKLRDTTGSRPVFGSSGQVGTHSAALTAGPTLIIGRKGNVGAIHYSSEACWPIDTVYYVEPPAGQNLRYYKYLLESLNLVKLDKSTAVPGLSRDDYNAVTVVVAPPAQQDSIVAEIEKQFSRLDEAVANLKRVKANLKRYKAAVLKAAVEGRLAETEAERARREGRSYETGAELLQRILETRRSQWQGKGKYKEPAAPDTTDLPELPEGWVWASADQLADKITDGEHISPNVLPSGVPLLSAKDVREFGVVFEDAKYVSSDDATRFRGRCNPDRGDILVVSRGATVGRACRVNIDQTFCLMGSVILMKLHKLIESNYALFALKAGFFVTRLTAVSGSTAQQAIYIRDIRPLPLPPLVEQQRIIAEVDRRLSLLRKSEAQVEANLQRAERLRQAILARAFSGVLINGNRINSENTAQAAGAA